MQSPWFLKVEPSARVRLLPTVILAGVHVAGHVDTKQAHIVDRQDRKLLDHEPAVTVAAHRRADDVGRVAKNPGVQRRAAEVGNPQFDRQGSQTSIEEAMLERIPPGLGNRERIACRVLGKRAAASSVVACADHEARTGSGDVSVVVEAGVEHEVAAVGTGRIVDRG